MKTIISGSRVITNYDLVYRAVMDSGIRISEVFSGGARGVDLLGEQYAEDQGFPIRRFPADWHRHGQRAGYIRNAEMVKHADALIAVWDFQSPDTKHLINAALKDGVLVHVAIANGLLASLKKYDLPLMGVPF